jgi:hypothetical protein
MTKNRGSKADVNLTYRKQQLKGLREEALKIARSRQLPGQTKEQTKIIAQGIEKGIEQYLKQQAEKNRELDKALKKAKRSLEQDNYGESAVNVADSHQFSERQKQWLPWVLLALSWIGFVGFLVLKHAT